MANAPKKEEMVTIHLFKDKDKYKHDLKVGLNGRIYRIQRGVDVQVPKAVAEIIYASLEQDGKTADLISRKKDEYESAVKQGAI
jgi:hypothetical protein